MSIEAISWPITSGSRVRAGNAFTADMGMRLRALRMNRGKSQVWLGEQIGCTFQQIQKFEKGTNKIAVTRLLDICRVLNADWDYFLDPLRDDEKVIMGALRNINAAEMLAAFERITDGKTKRALITLAGQLAEKAS